MRDFFFDDPFFKSSWDDFEKVRATMFSESRDMWKKFDDDFRGMACMSNNIMIDSSINEEKKNLSEFKGLDRQNSLTKWENGWMFPRRWMLPSLKGEFKDMDLFKEKDSEVIRVKSDDRGQTRGEGRGRHEDGL